MYGLCCVSQEKLRAMTQRHSNTQLPDQYILCITGVIVTQCYTQYICVRLLLVSTNIRRHGTQFLVEHCPSTVPVCKAFTRKTVRHKQKSKSCRSGSERVCRQMIPAMALVNIFELQLVDEMILCHILERMVLFPGLHCLTLSWMSSCFKRSTSP